jgi:hypothetical protein
MVTAPEDNRFFISKPLLDEVVDELVMCPQMKRSKPVFSMCPQMKLFWLCPQTKRIR